MGAHARLSAQLRKAGSPALRGALLRYALVALLSSALTSMLTPGMAPAVLELRADGGGRGWAALGGGGGGGGVGGGGGGDARPAVPVFVLVKTVAKDVERRRVMRGTWLAQVARLPGFEYKFFCEQPHGEHEDALAEEVRREGDIVVLDGLKEQAHRKIGIKMIRSFEWIVEHRSVQHIVMADDDTYVNVAKFAADVPTWAPRLHYMGRQMAGMSVIKVPKGTVRVGKYGETHDFPVNTWPRYASGPLYALSADLVAAFTDPVLPLRDMSSNDAMTGAVLMPYANVTYADRSGMKMWGHKLGAPCTPAAELYAFHLTPWKNTTGRGEWRDAVATLHQNITAGLCIPGFH